MYPGKHPKGLAEGTEGRQGTKKYPPDELRAPRTRLYQFPVRSVVKEKECPLLNTFEQAMRYVSDYGYSVIPVGPDKRPLTPWKELQERLPTYGEIRDWWTRFPAAWVGIVTGVVSGVVVIDIDDLAALDSLAKYIPESLITPTANTQGGGQHWYFRHPGGSIGNATKVISGVDFRGDGGYVVAPPSEGYTWVVEPTVELAELPMAFIALLKMGGSAPIYHDISDISGISPAFLLGKRDDDLFHTAYAMAKGGATREDVTNIVLSMAAACQPPFPKDQALIKIRSAFARVGEGSTAEDVREWIKGEEGYFPVSDLIRDFDLKTPTQKANLRNILSRLKAEGFIERYGSRVGTYRRTSAPPEFESLADVQEEQEFPLKWPLGVEELVSVSKKSIVILAGQTNAGKTAFCINFCHLNMDHHKISYFSTETTAARFKSRLKYLPRPIEDWSKIRFTDKVLTDLHLYVDPEGVNVIDYLEPDVEMLWRIGLAIQKIFDALTTGVAIIAIQKKKGADLGVGGMFTAFKSELYLAISSGDGNEGEVKIVKGKTWRHPAFNPYLSKRNFFIEGGVVFTPSARRPEWYTGEGTKERDY